MVVCDLGSQVSALVGLLGVPFFSIPDEEFVNETSRKVMSRTEIYRTINEFYLNPVAYLNRIGIKDTIYRKNLFSRTGGSVSYLVRRAFQTHGNKIKEQYVGGNWIVHGTNNQRASLDFLLRQPEFTSVEISSRPDEKTSIDFYPQRGLFQIWRYLLFFFVELIRNRKGFFGGLFHVVAYSGLYERHIKLLRLYRPRVIVLANDHVVMFRSLVMAARAEGIPTVYLQHACVGTDFPALISDLSLLEGEDSLAKYKSDNKKVYGEVKLVGIPKYDAFVSHVNTSTRVDRIGVPYNLTSDIEDLQKMVSLLAGKFPDIEFIVRKHPGDKREFLLASLVNVSYSNSKIIPAFTFIQSVDAIVAPSTSIHLEAALMNVYPIFIAYGKRSVGDAYRFADNGLVDACQSDLEVVEKIKEIRCNRPDVRSRTTYYNAAIGTPNEGESGRVATEAIWDFLSRWPE
jgi:hypothetical protein